MIIKIRILLFYHLIIVTNMVETKTKTASTRAKIAHKLARYYRATPVHLEGTRGPSQPSTSHLSNLHFTKPSEEPPKEDSETRPILGTQLMTRKNASLEQAQNPNQLKPENQSKPAQLSSFFQESAEEEELLS